MQRIVQRARVGSDGHVHVDFALGVEEAGREVQVTVEPVAGAGRRLLSASDLLNSGLVGLWADRTDIGDSREFARRLRQQAQSRDRDR